MRFTALLREQREVIGLLQTGTFLEYFDLMLYVHMAVLLNGLFFPQSDPKTAGLLSAFSFCSTFLLRPFGALLFGYIGDKIGRKPTVIITSMMMAISCIIMAGLPTYAEIGIAAAWMVTICRMLQGLSSLGEIIGAKIYLTETTQPPARYPAVALIDVAADLGSSAALGVATLVTSFGFNWRNAFWIGAIIAVVGFLARTRLRETRDFANMQIRMNKAIKELEKNWINNIITMVGFASRRRIRQTLEFVTIKKYIEKAVKEAEKKKVVWQTSLAYFLINCNWPVFFYFIFVHCGHTLQHTYNYTPEEIIRNNFLVSLTGLSGMICFTYLSYKFHPLKLLRVTIIVIALLILLMPYLLSQFNSPMTVFIIQCICMFCPLSDAPATPVFLIHFPIFQRFTYASLLYALSRAFVYIITSFGLVYLISFFGNFGLWAIMLPALTGFGWGVWHFTKLEQATEFIYEKKTLSQHLKLQGLR